MFFERGRGTTAFEDEPDDDHADEQGDTTHYATYYCADWRGFLDGVGIRGLSDVGMALVID
jgi:hypothetical protein